MTTTTTREELVSCVDCLIASVRTIDRPCVASLVPTLRVTHFTVYPSQQLETLFDDLQLSSVFSYTNERGIKILSCLIH